MSPDAARMVGILPKVVEIVSAPGHAGDPVGPVEEGREGEPVVVVPTSAEAPQRLGRAVVDPGRSTFALDLFEP